MAERNASLAVVYFGIGFTLMAAITMVALIALRPMILADSPPFIARLAMFSPLILGGVFGMRVAWYGLRENLRLGAALKRALRP